MRTLPHLLLLLLFMVHEKVKATDEWPLPDSGQNNVTFTSKVASRNIGSITLKKSYMTNFRLMLFAPWFPSNWNTTQDGTSKQGNERSTDSSAEGKCTISIQLSDQNCKTKNKMTGSLKIPPFFKIDQQHCHWHWLQGDHLQLPFFISFWRALKNNKII